MSEERVVAREGREQRRSLRSLASTPSGDRRRRANAPFSTTAPAPSIARRRPSLPSCASDPGLPVDAPSRTTLVVVMCVLGLGALLAIRSLIGPLLLGACVAGIVRPWMEAIERRVGGRTRAAAAATAGVVCAVGIPLALIAMPMAAEARALVSAVREGALGPLERLFGGGATAGAAAEEAPRSLHAIFHAAVPRLAEALPAIVGYTSEIALAVFVFVMTLYYVLLDGSAAMRLCRRVSPLAHAHLDALVREFVEVGRGVLLSIGLTSVVEGGAAGIAYAALGLPSAGLLTLLTMLAAIVPIGTVLVWGPVATMLFMQGREAAAAVVVATGVIVIGGIDHLARPQLARLAKTRLHPLLVFLGMFGGMASLGGAGLLVGPLLLALGLAAIRLYDRDARARRRLDQRDAEPTNHVDDVDDVDDGRDAREGCEASDAGDAAGGGTR